jgi:hypothetical protein
MLIYHTPLQNLSPVVVVVVVVVNLIVERRSDPPFAIPF